MKFESKADRIKAQQKLRDLGFYSGALDGVWEPASKKAYSNYLATRPNDTIVIEPPVAKTWWTSRAILGNLGTLISIGAGFFALNIDAGAITNVLVLLSGLITAVVSLWGSMERKGPINTDRIAGNLKWSSFTGHK